MEQQTKEMLIGSTVLTVLGFWCVRGTAQAATSPNATNNPAPSTPLQLPGSTPTDAPRGPDSQVHASELLALYPDWPVYDLTPQNRAALGALAKNAPAGAVAMLNKIDLDTPTVAPSNIFGSWLPIMLASHRVFIDRKVSMVGQYELVALMIDAAPIGFLEIINDLHSGA